MRPQWLNVNVTYVRDGFVTLKPMTQKLPDIPLTSSTLIQHGLSVLMYNFVNAQTLWQNNIADVIPSFIPDDTQDSQYDDLAGKVMVSTHYAIAPTDH